MEKVLAQQGRTVAQPLPVNRIYACLELLCYTVDKSEILSNDFFLAGFGHTVDGVYRRVTPEYLAWMHHRLTQAANSTAVTSEKFGETAAFYHDLLRATGFQPAQQAPEGYQKPEFEPWPPELYCWSTGALGWGVEMRDVGVGVEEKTNTGLDSGKEFGDDWD